MEITEADVQQLINIYESEYEVTLSPNQARREATKLFQLYKLLYLTPLPNNAHAAISNSPFPCYTVDATRKINK